MSLHELWDSVEKLSLLIGLANWGVATTLLVAFACTVITIKALGTFKGFPLHSGISIAMPDLEHQTNSQTGGNRGEMRGDFSKLRVIDLRNGYLC